MAPTDLMRRWEQIRAHLAVARSCRPLLAPAEDRSVQEWLDNNELGLALDDLEFFGGQVHRPAEFWEALASAADLMEMPDRAAKIRSRLN